MFLIHRRAWWSGLEIIFATVLGITHRVAARVSKALCQLSLKRFLKMLESGIDPATVRFEVENARIGTNIRKSGTLPLKNLNPSLQRRYSRLYCWYIIWVGGLMVILNPVD